MDMSTFDEFYRDNLGNNQTTLQAKSLSQDKPLNTNSTLNQASNGNASQNNIAVPTIINSQGKRHPITGQLNWGPQACRTRDYQLWLLPLSITICSRQNPNETI